jgi:hypothetical protein
MTPFASYTAAGQALRRAAQSGYFTWLEHIRPAAGCTRPIRLLGLVDAVEAGTGRHLHRRHTNELPDSAIYKACGNRRVTVCPACAHVYQRDAFQLVRTGLVGGKGIPDTVSQHPAVFATFTAPSFGTVHTRVVRKHTCRDRRRCDCRPEPCHARRGTGLCEHGRPAVCWARHQPNDAVLGRPLCLDCYDHDHHVVWNVFSGQLWHRTKHAIERHLAQLARIRGIPPVSVVTRSGSIRRVPPVRVSHGKAAEFQARGAVHFHVLLRLDGMDPADPTAVVSPPAGITVADLENAIRHAATHVGLHTPAHPDAADGWPIGWGEQVDVRPVSVSGRGEVTDLMVAGYLAKYATKGTEVTGHRSTRLNGESIGDHADPDGDHTARLIDACWRLGRPAGTPTPFADRPQPERPTPGFRDRWTCPACGLSTRYPACPTCIADRQAQLDAKPPNSSGGNPYTRLRRWAHMLGFGGHFLTKARRYSITFATLRAARVAFRRDDLGNHSEGDPAHRPEVHSEADTTLIVGSLRFAGVGWHTRGDALLANTAAALARERDAAGREELAHEFSTTLVTAQAAA